MRTLPRFVLGVIALAAIGCQNGEFKMPDFLSSGTDAANTKAPDSKTGSTSSTAGATKGSTAGGAAAGAGAASSTSGDSTASTGAGADSTGGASSTEGGAGAYSVTEPTSPQNKKEDVDVSGTEHWGWSDAKVGWMIRQKMQGGMEMVQEVKDLDDKRLLMLSKSYMNGSLMSASLMWQARYFKKIEPTDTTQADCKTTELPAETLTVAGKSLKCKVTKAECTYNGTKQTSKTWICDDVPGTLVKTDAATGADPMATVLEVVDFKKT